MRLAAVMVPLAFMVAGCVGDPPPRDLADLPNGSLPATGSWWNATIDGTCLCYALPPVMSGRTDEVVHRFEVKNSTTNLTSKLRVSLKATPAGHNEFYVAWPSCTDEEVSDCRTSAGGEGHDQEPYEMEWPQSGTWRVVVYGAGAGVWKFDYSVVVSRERSVM